MAVWLILLNNNKLLNFKYVGRIYKFIRCIGYNNKRNDQDNNDRDRKIIIRSSMKAPYSLLSHSFLWFIGFFSVLLIIILNNNDSDNNDE